jgi:hypothetical protein
MLKAIFTYIDNNGNEVRKEIKRVIFVSNNKEVQYPDGHFYPSFKIESRIDECAEIDIIPGSKLEFVYE